MVGARWFRRLNGYAHGGLVSDSIRSDAGYRGHSVPQVVDGSMLALVEVLGDLALVFRRLRPSPSVYTAIGDPCPCHPSLSTFLRTIPADYPCNLPLLTILADWHSFTPIRLSLPPFLAPFLPLSTFGHLRLAILLRPCQPYALSAPIQPLPVLPAISIDAALHDLRLFNPLAPIGLPHDALRCHQSCSTF